MPPFDTLQSDSQISTFPGGQRIQYILLNLSTSSFPSLFRNYNLKLKQKGNHLLKYLVRDTLFPYISFSLYRLPRQCPLLETLLEGLHIGHMLSVFCKVME